MQINNVLKLKTKEFKPMNNYPLVLMDSKIKWANNSLKIHPPYSFESDNSSTTDGDRSNKKMPSKTIWIFRYDKPEYVTDFITNHKIAFIRPNKWADPYESLFYDTNGVNINNSTYDVLCICAKYDWARGEESAWKSYGHGHYPVRVKYNFLEFVKLLNNIALNESDKIDLKFYISLVDYSYTREEINKFYQNKQINDYISISEYLTYLSLKRNAFSHEREIRIFAVKEKKFDDRGKGYFIFDLNDIIHKHNEDLIKNIISEITLPPFDDNINRLIFEATAINYPIKCKQTQLYTFRNDKKTSSY